jgi:CubicO group peptidase (beta-lactamase class C family)
MSGRDVRTHLGRIALSFALLTALVACRPSDGGDERVTGIQAEELEQFIDRFFAKEMRKRRIPGLTIVIVQDGQILLSKGYGDANRAKGTPVDPDHTVMRIGSISKLFVATAVMQLVEQGLLELDADVNLYVETFQLEDGFSEPVTLGHLLTHTAGFQDPPYETFTDSTQVRSLGAYLATHMPPRAHPPGQTFAYSSLGYALAAYVVEQVSGIPFDQYVREEILSPLDMDSSGYVLSPPLPDLLATGYLQERWRQVAQPFDYDEDYPSGSMVSTANDMARFMIAHLQEGCYGDACILRPETVAQMQQRQASTPYEGQHVTYGFVEAYKRGQRLIGHSGAIRGFGSILDLLPERGLGYFLSFNQECYRTNACEIIPEFREQFIEQYFR